MRQEQLSLTKLDQRASSKPFSEMVTISDEGASRAVRHLEIYAVPTQATPLLPDHICDAIIARSKVVYPPMGERIAKIAAVNFLSGRPYLADKNGATIDKQVYFKKLTEVFAGFPEWVGVNVTATGSDFRRTHATWLPTSDELFEALTKEAGKDRVAAYTAGLHKKEAERRRAEDHVTLTPDKRAELANKFAGLAAKLKSTPIVEPVAGKEPGPSPEQIAERKRIAEDLAARGARRAEFEAYATHVGNGDLAGGRRALVSDGIFEAPADWREKCGRQGEVA